MEICGAIVERGLFDCKWSADILSANLRSKLSKLARVAIGPLEENDPRNHTKRSTRFVYFVDRFYYLKTPDRTG